MPTSKMTAIDSVTGGLATNLMTMQEEGKRKRKKEELWEDLKTLLIHDLSMELNFQLELSYDLVKSYT